ncbi:MAG: hypothetical protein DRJ08_03680 [Acidobacteria bacterium]|nr:MAG: hypothetical protein DRJ08_03680 [Acidobacteriota bacterium]
MNGEGEKKKLVKRLKMQVRFSKASNFQPGLITEISTSGLTLLCKEKPENRTITLSLAYQSLTTDIVCEALRQKTVDIHGHTLNHLELKIVAAPLSYLDIVDAIDAQQEQSTAAASAEPPASKDTEEEIMELLPEDLEE